MTAVEGITKLFNAMGQVQKETLDEIVKMGISDNLKAMQPKKRQFKKKGGAKKGFLDRKF